MVISPFEYARRVKERRSQLYRMAYCYVKNEQDALDIVSDAVFKGLVALPRLREPEYFDTWLTRIVVINSAIKQSQKHFISVARSGTI